MNTREQNQRSLTNFDLSEYRQVLNDTCVKIYQDMVKSVQQRIHNLIGKVLQLFSFVCQCTLHHLSISRIQVGVNSIY